MYISNVILVFKNAITNYLKTYLNFSLDKLSSNYELLFSLSLIFLVSFIFILITKRRVEFIPLYIISGIVIGPIGLGIIKDTSIVRLLSEMGIAFLLFVAGMEINSNKLKDAIRSALKLGVLEFIFVFLFSFFAFKFLNFKIYEVIYLAFVLTLSSTVVIVKVMTDKRELNTLHARVLLGILLLQDILAILFLTLFKESSFSPYLIMHLVNFLIILTLAFIFKRFLVEKLLDFASRNQELLLILTLSILFAFSIITAVLGLSIVIAAFIAGMIIADSKYKVEIEGRIKPLRDFFALIFFVSLGMQLVLSKFNELWLPFIVYLVLVFVIKPVITYLLSEIFGYKKTTSFAVALPLANLSEFGLVIGLQGLAIGQITSNVFNLILLSTITTMTISPYLIKYHYKIYKFFSRFFILSMGIEKKLEYKSPQKEKILLIGCHRMGSIIIERLKKFKNRIFVIDHNPDIIKALIRKKITCVYGDASANEVLDIVKWEDIEVVISTIPNIELNEFLINYTKLKKKGIKFIATAERIDDAISLYNKGADFVILPHPLAGSKVSEFILKVINKEVGDLEKFREDQLNWLNKIHRILY